MPSNASSGVLHFSTEALPERDRMAIWREVFGRRMLKAEFEAAPSSEYYFKAALHSLPGISLATSAGSAFSALRTRQMVAEGNDDLTLTINLEGRAHAAQLGRESTIDSDEGVFLSGGNLGEIRYPGDARFIIFCLPHKTIASATNNIEARLGSRLPSSEVLRLLTTYAAALDRQPMMSPVVRQTYATHLTDLMMLAINANRDVTEVARGRGLQAARLQAIKDDILSHIADERLSITALALRHRMSSRYIQLLFETEGQTFSEYVIELRLEHAYRMLGSAKYFAWTIGAIAFEVGFSNLSYFNRTFRRRYGATPSDIRATVRGSI